MSKQIDKKFLYLRLPEIVTSIVERIVKEYDNTPVEATIAFYKSSTFSKLEDWKTGFWKKSTDELYSNFVSEIKY